MSKRVADGQGGAERYGGMDTTDPALDPPRKATAAQLAKRSIKPLKGRPSSSSRASSPSKASPSPSFNPFGGAENNPFGQSAPAPPSANSFNFGPSASQPQSNPFSSMSTSQSFPPAAPTNNQSATFSFGQSQPAQSPAFAPPASTSFNFGTSTPSGTSFGFGASPAKPQQNGENKTPSFTFGQTPASPAPSAPASPAPVAAFNPFASMSGPSFGGDKPISAAEINEIESAGPRLSQEGKLDELANIVRQSEPKYKDANLAGLDLSTLPAAVQKKMLDFVRAKSETKQPEQPKPSFSFSSTTPAPSTSFSFGASTTTAPSSSQPEAQSSPFKGFGATDSSATPATSSFKFGAPAESTLKNDAAPAASPFNFGGSAEKAETPAKAPAASFNFGAAAKKDDAPAASPFSFGASTAQKDETPAKPPAPAFNFGAAASTAPASPKPAEKQLPSFSFGSTSNTPKPAEDVSYPKLNGVGSSQSESTAPPAPSFSFGQSTSTPAAASSPFKPSAPTPASESQNAGLGSSIFSSAPAQQKPTESAFKGFGASTSTPSQSSAPSSGFAFGSSLTAQTPAPSASMAKSPQPSESNALARTSASSGVATPPASPQLQPTELASALIQQLNESLRAHLASSDASQDWSSMMRYYLDQISEIRRENCAAPSAKSIDSPSAPQAIAAPLAPSTTRGEKRPGDEEVNRDDEANKRSKMSFSASTTPTKPLSSTATLFDDILSAKTQTPQQANVFAAGADKTPAPPATAPPTKSNPFATISRNVSATPGPKFTPSAGAAAQPTASPFQIKPASTAAPAAAPASSGFQVPKFGGGGGSSTNFMGSFGQQAAKQEAKARELRKLEDMDSDEDEDEWERRDAEEQARKKAEFQSAGSGVKFSFDTSKESDKGASPVFSYGTKSSTSTTSSAPTVSSNMFGHLSGSKDDDDENDADTDEDDEVHEVATSSAKPAESKSLFERVSFGADTDKGSAPGTPGASFKFSSFGNNTSPAGDNTWKENTPIKFGASTAGTTTPDGSPAKAPATSMFGTSSTTAAPPKFNFGASSQATPSSDKPSAFSGMFGAKTGDTPKPAAASSTSIFDAAKSGSSTVGFNFGSPGGAASTGLAPPSGSSVFASAATSRATTPGATTTDAEGSAAESEPSDTPNDAQRDLSALTPEEVAANNLAYEGRCKAMKFNKEKTPPWQSEGLGPVRILTVKETNKPRILMRTDPGGKVALNFNVVLNKELYTHKGGKLIQLTVPGEDKKMETYMCTFKDEAKAKEFLTALHDAITNAQG